VTREWVRRAAPLLVIALKLAQLAMTAYGIPFPLPTMPFDVSFDAFLGTVLDEIGSEFTGQQVQELITEGVDLVSEELQEVAVEAFHDNLDEMNEAFVDETEAEDEAYSYVQEALIIVKEDGDSKVRKSKTKKRIMESTLKMHVQEGTELAFQAVKELLLRMEKPPSGGDGAWKPEHTGLEMMIATDGTSAWVSEEGKALFMGPQGGKLALG